MAGGHAEHLAPAAGIDADGDDGGNGDDAVAAPDFDVGGIQPDIGPVALERPGEEGADALVDLAAQARDLAFADAFHPSCIPSARGTLTNSPIDASAPRVEVPGL